MAKFRKKVYSPETRQLAVEEVLATARTVADVADEMGVNPNTLQNWVRDYRLTHPDDTR